MRFVPGNAFSHTNAVFAAPVRAFARVFRQGLAGIRSGGFLPAAWSGGMVARRRDAP
ncbi:hypothetical protein [Azospirillum sp. Marseille-Q6669]